MKKSLFLVSVLFLAVLLTGYLSGGTVLEIFFNSRNGAVPVYRFFNTARGGHLYTISEVERDYILENLPQWTYEGIKFDVHDTLAGGTCAAYRFFNTRTGIHFYTINEAERDAVMQLDHYNYEGIKYYVFADFAQNTTAVYRFFNHVRGGHLYTVSEAERDAVMQLPNWTYEGISFYVFPHQENTFAPVPRTGQTTSYMDGDDGDYQMGVEWPEPRFTDHGDGTVTDNLTGLMWTKNADIDGAKTWDDAIDWCNALDHAGYTDWRLPNVRELYSLLDFEHYGPALTDGHPFENVHSEYGSPWDYLYWSSSTSVHNPTSAYMMGFYPNWLNHSDKTNLSYVWPVRGVSDGNAPIPRTGQITSYRTGDDGYYKMGVVSPGQRFTDNNDGTITDNMTGLMWTKNVNLEEDMPWQDAIEYCNTLVYGDYEDWRLPNILELYSLIDISEWYPALPEGNPFIDAFSNREYWSSTTTAYGPNAMYMYLIYGRLGGTYKGNSAGVWPVRGGQ